MLHKAGISCLVFNYSKPPVICSYILHFQWFFTFYMAPAKWESYCLLLYWTVTFFIKKGNVKLSAKHETCVIAPHIFDQHRVLSHSLKQFHVVNLGFVNSEMQYCNCKQFWSLTVTSTWTSSLYKCPLHITASLPVPQHTFALLVCYCISSLT